MSRAVGGGLLLALLAGCLGGSGSGLDESGRPIGEGDLPLGPTLASIQKNIFDAECIQCHAGAAAPLGLRLTEGESFGALVGVPSAEFGGAVLARPFDPEESYLVRKLEGRDIVGDRMPQGLPPLDAEAIEAVRDWIANGARESESVESFRVTALAPEPGAVLTVAPAEVRATFSERVRASTVGQATVLLLRSGGDGTFDDGDEAAIAPAAVGLDGPNEAVLDLAGVPLPADTYQVRLVGSGAQAVLRDEQGRALDGEFDGEFPSGDGLAGGDFVATFVYRPILRVVAMTPAPGATLGALPSAISVTFNIPPDVATVTAETFRVSASGGDGTFEDGNEVPVTGPVTLTDAQATLDASGFFGLQDAYQARLAGISSADAGALDGEFTGALPSGDGAPGGDFVAAFEVGLLPTLSSIQRHVFDLYCLQCHFGPTAPRGLRLEEGLSYGLMVDVPSAEVPALDLVEPGAPDESYLVLKLEGGPGIIGGRMPLFSEPLDDGTIGVVRQWIADGAEDD